MKFKVKNYLKKLKVFSKTNFNNLCFIINLKNDQYKRDYT